tara:strand:+ start:404 stop:571 length:168 start_codon:yes stop_codon:yes gene_type:complete
MHPIKLSAGEPMNKVIIVGKIISLGRLTNIPKIGVKITIGRQFESQWEKLFAKEI